MYETSLTIATMSRLPLRQEEISRVVEVALINVYMIVLKWQHDKIHHWSRFGPKKFLSFFAGATLYQVCYDRSDVAVTRYIRPYWYHDTTLAALLYRLPIGLEAMHADFRSTFAYEY
jgi:hypothetical protein